MTKAISFFLSLYLQREDRPGRHHMELSLCTGSWPRVVQADHWEREFLCNRVSWPTGNQHVHIIRLGLGLEAIFFLEQKEMDWWWSVSIVAIFNVCLKREVFCRIRKEHKIKEKCASPSLPLSEIFIWTWDAFDFKADNRLRLMIFLIVNKKRSPSKVVA